MFSAAPRQLAQQILAVYRDAGQWVVDLVHDACGELPERGQFLGVNDLPLERAHFGSVLPNRDHAGNSSFGVENGCQRELQARISAPSLGQPQLERRDISATERVDEGR